MIQKIQKLSFQQRQEVQWRWLIRAQEAIIKGENHCRIRSAIILHYLMRRTSENLECGFPSKLRGVTIDYFCPYMCLVPEVAEKLKIKQQPFSEAVREIGYSAPLPLWGPSVIIQG